MVHGIGVDLVRISRIEAALERFGERFARRILTQAELREYARRPRRADFLAKHFAAKEALVKALGTGIRMGIQWHDAEVRRDALGKPYFVCSGRVSELFSEQSVGASHLSISDEDGFAMAFVVLERARG